jgi:hypothetical protein
MRSYHDPQDPHLCDEACEGKVTVTDPTHPLYGRVLKMLSMARLPDAVRYCRLELSAEQSVYVAIASTNLHPSPPREPTILTLDAMAALVATFQTLPVSKRRKRAADSRNLDPSARKRSRHHR